MTHHPSRKDFFAKLIGSATAVLLLPRLFGASRPAQPVAATAPLSPPSAPTVRRDARTVARRELNG